MGESARHKTSLGRFLPRLFFYALFSITSAKAYWPSICSACVFHSSLHTTRGLPSAVMPSARLDSSIGQFDLRVFLGNVLRALAVTKRVLVHDLKLLRLNHAIMRLLPKDGCDGIDDSFHRALLMD